MSALEDDFDLEAMRDDLPACSEAEQSVLGTILCDGKAIARVIDLLEPSDFFFLDNRQIYEVMADLFKTQRPIDPVSVKQALRKAGAKPETVNYAMTLVGVVSLPSALEGHAQMVFDAAQGRKVVKAGRALMALPGKCDNPEEIQQGAFTIMGKLIERHQKQSPIDLSSITAKVFAGLEERYENGGELPGVSSGYIDVDSITAGWKKGHLIIIAGRPAMGKTAFAVCCAHNAVKRKKMSVALFSLEMTKEELVERMLSREAEVDGELLTSGKLEGDMWQRVHEASKGFYEWVLSVYDQTNAVGSVYQIEAKLRQLELAGKKPDLVVVDYLQLLSVGGPDRKERNRNLDIEEVSRALKSIAMRLGVPIIALSQLSRAVEMRQNKRPVLSDLRDSGSIEQDADMVIFLYRDEYYNEDSESKGEAEVIVSKNRNGRTGTAHLLFRSNMCAFYDRDPSLPRPARKDVVQGSRYRSKNAGTPAAASQQRDD